jgi:hypothetical protein
MVGPPCYQTLTLNKGKNGGVQSEKGCYKWSSQGQEVDQVNGLIRVGSGMGQG